MKASWKWFGRVGRVTWKSCGGGWLVPACAVVLAVLGCGYPERPFCSDVDSSADCETPEVNVPPDTLACDLYPVDGSATGICVPYVDAGWHTMLARLALVAKNQLHCPPSAPNAGLVGVEIPDGPGLVPRRAIGCSVNPLSTCPSAGLACVPFEPAYPACITQSALHDCPPEYPDRTEVEEDGPGAAVTVCCRPPAEIE